MTSVIYWVTVILCVRAQTTPSLQVCDGPGDIIFIIDGSESITSVEFFKVKSFVEKNIQQFTLNSTNSVRIGALVFGEVVSDWFSFRDIPQIVSLVQARILSFKQPKRATDTHIALNFAVEMFVNDTVRSVPEVAVLITDGESSNNTATLLAAKRARYIHNIEIIAVLVGEHNETVDNAKQEVTNITGSASNVILLKDYDDLSTLVGKAKLNTKLCQAVTTTTSTTTTTTTPSLVTGKIVVDALCQGCIIDEGTGFNWYRPDCSKFVHCYMSSNQVMAEVKKCSFGQFWSQYYLTCVNSTQSECTSDPCVVASSGSSRAMTDNCRGFWVCFNGKSTPACCSNSQRFVPGVGCQIDTTCNDDCPPKPSSRNFICDKTVDVSNIAYFFQYQQGRSLPVRMPCSPGTLFDRSTCSCAINVRAITASSTCMPLVYFNNTLVYFLERGSSNQLYVGGNNVLFIHGTTSLVRFTGNSVVNIWRLSNYHFRKIAVLFEITIQSTNTFLPEQILVNCLHANGTMIGPSIEISITKSPAGSAAVLSHRLVTTNATAVLTTLVPVGIRTEVIYAYDGSKFVCSSGGTESFVAIEGSVALRQTGFVFGRPWNDNGNTNYFVGDLSNIQIYDCINDGIKSKLTHL